MRLAVYRWLGVNAGDHAVQQALVDAFGPDVEWVSIDVWASADEALDAVAGCDGLVVGGGTILGNLRTWLVDDATLPRIRVPIGLFGTGIRDEGRTAIDAALRAPVAEVIARSHPRGVRGPLSAALLAALGPSCPPVEVAGDTALLLDVREHRVPPAARAGVGVNLRVRRDGGEAATLATYRAWLAGAGRRVADDVRFFACDRAWDPRAADRLGASVEPYADLPTLLRWLAGRRLVISERLHGAVLAHALGVPAVLVAYERKCWDYARAVGLLTSCVAPGDAHALATAVEGAAADLARARPAIERLRRAGRAAVEDFRTRVRRATRRRPRALPTEAPSRPGDGRTLIGLLMIRDEDDMLAEALRNHARFCDAILVLDGSDDAAYARSRAIAAACPSVREHWRDADTGFPLPLRDGARRFLLERARARFGRGNWYAILHGDELWGEDPRPYLDAMPPDCDALAVRLFHFFPHPSQRGVWDWGRPGARDRSIEALARWYMLPPIAEHLIFWDAGHAEYDPARHSCTVPQGLATWQSDCVVKQYNYRSPEQAATRARQRARDGWQQNHYQHLLAGPDAFFRHSLEMPDAKWAESVPIGAGIATNVHAHPLKVWPADDADAAAATRYPKTA